MQTEKYEKGKDLNNFRIPLIIIDINSFKILIGEYC